MATAIGDWWVPTELVSAIAPGRVPIFAAPLGGGIDRNHGTIEIASASSAFDAGVSFVVFEARGWMESPADGVVIRLTPLDCMSAARALVLNTAECSWRAALLFFSTAETPEEAFHAAPTLSSPVRTTPQEDEKFVVCGLSLNLIFLANSQHLVCNARACPTGGRRRQIYVPPFGRRGGSRNSSQLRKKGAR
jgi:hypothetical protein